LRKKIQAEELEAERLQQIRLESCLNRFAVGAAGSREDCAAENIESHAASINAKIPQEQE
jgi:hypothetical protein